MPHPPPTLDRSAHRDPRLTARVVSRVPLHDADGPDPGLDRPGHVRAASAIVRVGRGHVIVQDDALFLACLGSSGITSVTLPSPDGVRQFDDGRGNKALKPDLEAACVWPTGGGSMLVGFGSGSTPLRERLLVARVSARGVEDDARFVDAGPLYAALRACLPAGAELNVEGAFRTEDGALRLLQRGNGRGGITAALDVHGPWLDDVRAGRTPRVVRVTRWHLGTLDGAPLAFTDGVQGSGSRWWFAAAAEASPDAVADGPVTGSAVGWADDEGGAWAPITDHAGAITTCKLEGLALVGPADAWGVVDHDDPAAPSELLHLRLDGPWPAW